MATIALAFAIAPTKTVLTEDQKNQMVDIAQVQTIIDQRCGTCHADSPTDEIFTIAPAGIIFSDEASIKQWAPRIKARVIDAKDMPFMNKTHMTDEERNTLAIWLAKNK